MRDVIGRLKDLNAERQKLIEQLEMWDKVKSQGIDPESVDVFGYDPKRLTYKQWRAALNARSKGEPDPITGKRYPRQLAGAANSAEAMGRLLYPGERLPNGHYTCEIYNYVKLKDGTQVILDPPIKAAPK